MKKSSVNKEFLWGASLVVLTFLAYLPVWRAGFVWDDSVMVVDNAMLRPLQGLRDFWITTRAVDPLPITMSALWAQWHLWDGRPLGYHIVNVLLHGLGAVLFWRVLRQFTPHGRLAWLAAAVFALHPVAVASAGWISEQKNTLSIVFYMLALLCWLRWSGGGGRGGYWLALLLFAGALLSKGSTVMLPVVLLLITWWRKGRVKSGDFWKTVPFFILSLGAGLATIWIQKHKAIGGNTVQTLNGPARVAAAAWEVWFYVWKGLAPVHLCVIYPNWKVAAGSAAAWLPALALAAVFAVCWRWRHGWGRHVLLGLGCYVVTLFPVLGLFDMYFLVFSRVADHWQYLALPPLLGLAVCGGGHLLLRAFGKFRPLLLTLSVVLLAALWAGTWLRAGVYRDEETLWTDTAKRNPQAWPAWNNLANALFAAGQTDAAIADYEKALALRPVFGEAESNLGNALVAKSQLAEAVLHLQKAVEEEPLVPRFHFNYGVGLASEGRLDEAVAEYNKALDLEPRNARVRSNLAGVFYNQKKYLDALDQAQQAMQIDPDLPEPYLNAAKAQAGLGRIDEASQNFDAYVQRRPNDAGARFEYGMMLALHGNVAAALPQFQAVVRLKPDYGPGHSDLGSALARLGRPAEAAAEFRASLRLEPNDARDENNLATALVEEGQLDEAMAHYATAIRLDPNDPGTRVNYSQALLRQGKRAEAVAQLREALRLKPGEPAIQRLLDQALQ